MYVFQEKVTLNKWETFSIKKRKEKKEDKKKGKNCYSTKIYLVYIFHK